MTAYVVISMLEGVTGIPYNSRVSDLSSTISYLEGSMSKVEDNPYQLAIIGYALQLAKSSAAENFLMKLEGLQRSAGKGYL